MAEYYGFFDGSTEYGQDSLLRYYKNMFRSGIGVSDAGVLDFAVTKGTGSLSLALGYAIIEGAFLYNDSLKTLAVATPVSYSRIDRVVIRLDYSLKTVAIVLKAGTPASNPVAPTLQRDAARYEISLAQVKITTTGVITVTDERANTTLCGTIRPRNGTEFDAALKSYREAFESWFATQQGVGWRQIFVQTAEPVGAEVGALWRQIK